MSVMISEYKQQLTLRWADLDPNAHVRHSVYYDFGASLRVDYFTACGVTFDAMAEHCIGPVLFREEAVFRHEIRFGDRLWMNLLVTRLRRDGARFSFRHELFRDDGIRCAVLHVDGAWIDTSLRKLTIPPDFAREMLESAPRSADFEWSEGEKKQG